MKKSIAILGTILTAGMLTAPVYAANSPSLYISGDVGASWFNDFNASHGGNISTTGGVNALGALGVKWCDTYRLEAEFGYQRNNLDKLSQSPGVVRNLSGFHSATSVLANGYYDFDAGSIKPYLTAGLGWASVGINGSVETETHSAFAYQVGAGLSIPLAKNVDIDARYRYFRTSTVSNDYWNDSFQIVSHSVLAGLRVGF